MDSFDHLFALVSELEVWMRAGKLNNVAPGEPILSDRDLSSFLYASRDRSATDQFPID